MTVFTRTFHKLNKMRMKIPTEFAISLFVIQTAIFKYLLPT